MSTKMQKKNPGNPTPIQMKWLVKSEGISKYSDIFFRRMQITEINNIFFDSVCRNVDT